MCRQLTTLRQGLSCLSIVLAVACLLSGCSPPSARCSKFEYLYNLSPEQRKEAFLLMSPEEQVDAYQCAMTREPAYSKAATFLAEHCDQTVPIITERLRDTQNEQRISDLLTALMLMSSECRPAIEIRRAALEAAEVAVSSMPKSSIWKENGADQVRIIGHYWNGSSR